MMSYSFRDKPRTRLSDRLRGKSGDELLQELRQEFDKDRTSFFDPNPNWGFTPAGAGSAFPRRHMFDDDVDDVLRSHGRGRTNLRAHLDDLARRHPEFADSLRSPPGWVSDFHPSASGGESGSSSGGHFAGSYGGSAASEGGYFGEGERSNLNNNNKSHHPQPQDPQPPSEEQRPPAENIQERKTSSSYSSAPPPPFNRDSLSHGLRNTDPEIGLKGQAAVKENRNQRSMSAPPDGRSPLNSDKPQRFVSKIEINPVNPATGETAGSVNSDNGSGKPPMAPPKQQPQQQPHQGTPPQHKTSTVRHIPIFVEGRDEPVLPKNIDQDFAAPPQQFSSPHPQQQQQPAQPQRKQSQHQQQANRHQQPPPQQQQPPPPPPPQQQPQQQESKENIHQQQQQPSAQPQAEKKQKVNNDPLYQIQLVQNEVDELHKRIVEFKGTSKTDKDYIYLDEMLTRNLIKLDVIETEGKENIRAARKATIKSIQQCINLLESKIPQTPISQTPSSTNINENSAGTMEVDEDKTKIEKVDILGGSENQGNQTAEQPTGGLDGKQKMETDQQPVGQNDKNNANKETVIDNQQQNLSPEVQSSQPNADNHKDKNTNGVNPNEIKC